MRGYFGLSDFDAPAPDREETGRFLLRPDSFDVPGISDPSV